VKKRDRIRRGIRRVRKLLADFTKEPLTAKSRRGIEAEEKALNAARYWLKKKIVLEVRQTERFSPEDRAGKDLILTLLDGQELPIQVKDYCNFEAVQKCRENGVFLLTIWDEDDVEIAKKAMLNLIISAYFSGLEPFQLRQLIAKIPEIKGLFPKKPGLIKKISSWFRRVSS